MQIKIIGTFLAASASFALILASGHGYAERLHSTETHFGKASLLGAGIQDGDIPAPADVVAPPLDAKRTASGIAYKVLSPGTGSDHPLAVDEVTVHYSGWTVDGKMFDSSVKRNTPSSFPLGGVISGWTEGLQLMVVGEKTRFWIPEELAYQGRAGKPAGMLVFDIELLGIKSKPIAPLNLNAPPAEATTTASGLKIHSLRKGSGSVHPGASDQVTVHYSGWTTDGEMFDSSVARGEPASFPLGSVIAGWTEALQLMVVGEKARLWIPEELAYQGQPGAPAGTLVFDVELLSIIAAPKTPENLLTPPSDAIKTASGLVIHTMQPGREGSKVAGAKAVLVHFSFWDQTGKLHQSSIMSGRPVPMDLDRSPIAGLGEALKLMSLGQTARLWIPEELGFVGQPGAPEGVLVWDLEIMRIFTPPTDLATAPADAIKTASGLAYKVLRSSESPSGKSPMETSKVVMHFTGWLADGSLMESSYFQSSPATFPVDGVMPGWTEGLKLMKVGDSFRFWIPEALSFVDREGAPKGNLVFDFELLEIQ